MAILGSLGWMIGVGFILHKWMPFKLFLLYFHMIGTFLSLFIFKDETWTESFFVVTLLGQYIIKNCVLISAGIVIGASVKGRVLEANPIVKKFSYENEINMKKYTENIISRISTFLTSKNLRKMSCLSSSPGYQLSLNKILYDEKHFTFM